MNTRLVNSAAGVILAALTQNRTAAGIALALDSAQLLLTSETTAELKQLKDQVAELEAPAAAQRRMGYEAAIEVMRQEKLPMSVGLLEAQLELDKLDGLVPSELTVYRASHDSIPFGLYTTAEAAREHCETYERRDLPTAELDWIEDEEDGVAELVAAVGEEERSTGYVVTALTVASKYDPDAEE